MRKPLERVERQRLPHGSYNFVANATFADDQTETANVASITGARVGDPVIVSQIVAGGAATPGLMFWANVYQDDTVTVGCTNVTANIINRPATTLNFTVIPY